MIRPIALAALSLTALTPLPALAQESERPVVRLTMPKVELPEGVEPIGPESGVMEATAVGQVIRIMRLDDGPNGINAIVALAPDITAQARAARRLPLGGRTVLVKDNIETRELPTTAGSLALAGNMTRRDAPLIANLRAAGGVGRRAGWGCARRRLERVWRLEQVEHHLRPASDRPAPVRSADASAKPGHVSPTDIIRAARSEMERRKRHAGHVDDGDSAAQ